MLEFRVDKDLCISCGECVTECPADVLAMEGQPVMTNEDGCLKCMHCYAVCPTGALSILGHKPGKEDGGPDLPSPAQMTNLIKWRRSVRRYVDENVAPEIVDELLATTCYAPTGVNARDVLFTVIRDKGEMDRLRRDMLARLGELKESGRLPEGIAGRYLGHAVSAWQAGGQDAILRGAPHMILTSAPKNAPCPHEDTLIALTTFELLASSYGIGTLWVGMFMHAIAVYPELVERLRIPAGHTLGYAMLFGKPAVEFHRSVHRGPAKMNMIG